MTGLLCAECGHPFTRKGRARQQFCTPAHQINFHRTMANRGKIVMPLLLARSMGRHTKGDQLGGYCRREADALIARWNQDDRAAGRDPRLVAKHKMSVGWKGVDLE